MRRITRCTSACVLGSRDNTVKPKASKRAAPRAEVAINTKNAQSWMVGLQWDDVFVKGNSAGMGVGQAPFTTSTFDGSTPFDGNYTWEWWYNFKVSDNISVTPALYYLSQTAGQLGKVNDSSVNNFGGLIKTTFNF